MKPVVKVENLLMDQACYECVTAFVLAPS